MTAGTTALTAVQAGVYVALTGDAALMAMLPGGVHDHAPQDPRWPFLTIGVLREEARDTGGTQRRRVGLTLHVWSQYLGRSEACAVADRVMALLRYASLSLAGWTHEDTTHDATEADEPLVLADEGLQVQHVSLDFTAYVTEA